MQSLWGRLAVASAMAWRIAGRLETPVRAVVVLLGVWTIPGVLNLSQWDPVLLVAALLAWICHMGRRDVLAGALLSVAHIKPQLRLGVHPALGSVPVVEGPGGLAIGGGLLVAASAVMSGPASVAAWAGFAFRANGAFAVRGVGIPALAAVIAGTGAVMYVAAALAGITGVLAVALRHRLAAHREVVIPMGIAVSLLCAPHIFANDVLRSARHCCGWPVATPRSRS